MNWYQVSWPDILGFSVLAAIITTLGSLLATYLKEFVLARSIEKWKSKQQLRNVYLKLRDPLILATIELVHRFIEITFTAQVDFLDSTLLKQNPDRMVIRSAHDIYFRRYKLVSTLYRLCAWFGWVELYRQQVAFLDSGQQEVNSDFEEHIQMFRSSFAEGRINGAPNRLEWNDYLIFREEQRAIGEVLLEEDKQSVIGFGYFNDKFLSSAADQRNRWISIALNFLMDSQFPSADDRRDFRRARYLLIIKHGVSLIECLNHNRVTQHLKEAQACAERELEKYMINSDAMVRR